MIYKPNGIYRLRIIKRGGLFGRKYDYYDGSDFITGIYKNFRLSCSELDIEYDTYRASRLNQQKSIFKGLFFAAPINSFLAGGTYIWPRGDEQLANNIMDEKYRLIPLPRVYHIKMNNNSIFENHFCVYSTNPAEAKIIVDQEMMERIIKFKQQIKRNIRFSLVAGICHVAISINEELLEPSLSDPGNKEDIKSHFFSILLIFSIINQLNLGRLI